jgi:hypothetical protein
MPDRETTCKGLRALADYLEAHPDLPVPTMDGRVIPQGTDVEDRAEVDRIAAILGTPITVNPAGTHYETGRDFGGGVRYSAVAITSAEMDAWGAHMKDYRGPSRTREAGDATPDCR